MSSETIRVVRYQKYCVGVLAWQQKQRTSKHMFGYKGKQRSASSCFHPPPSPNYPYPSLSPSTSPTPSHSFPFSSYRFNKNVMP